MNGAILVVEDEPVTQKLITVNLERAGHQVLRAGSVPEAQAAIREVVPDLILLDWMLPKTTGVMFAKQLRTDRRTKDVPIIMLTARMQETDKVTGLEAGADDYIIKPFSPRELLARIKAVMRRCAPQLTDDVVEIAGLKVDPAAHRVSGGATEIDLGVTEFRMLHFFMTHPERVFTRGQLLDRVWGGNTYVEERTVDVHIRRLRKALEPFSLERLVQTVRGAGYRFSTREA